MLQRPQLCGRQDLKSWRPPLGSGTPLCRIEIIDHQFIVDDNGKQEHDTRGEVRVGILLLWNWNKKGGREVCRLPGSLAVRPTNLENSGWFFNMMRTHPVHRCVHNRRLEACVHSLGVVHREGGHVLCLDLKYFCYKRCSTPVSGGRQPSATCSSGLESKV